MLPGQRSDSDTSDEEANYKAHVSNKKMGAENEDNNFGVRRKVRIAISPKNVIF